MNCQIFIYFCICFIISSVVFAVDSKAKKKKDVRDFTDEDLDRLYEEWEANDEDVLEEDEKPFYERKQPPMPDLSKIVGGLGGAGVENLLKQSKKGQPVMLFAGIVNPSEKDPASPSKDFTDKLVKVWQSSLFNNHIESQVFVVENNRAVFLISEGSRAFEARDFLVKQPECSDVSLEGSNTNGAGYKYLKGKEKKQEL